MPRSSCCFLSLTLGLLLLTGASCQPSSGEEGGGDDDTTPLVSDDDASIPATACANNDQPWVGVLQTLTFARASDEGISSGFDLDETVTEEGGDSGCGIGDYTDPEGTPGIDNAFARLLPALEMTEAKAVEGLIQSAINSGELMILLRMNGVDDLATDDCVDLELLRGAGTPMLGTDGFLESHQTVGQDTEIATILQEGLTLSEGRVEARGVTLVVPITIFDVHLEFTMLDGGLRVDWNEDGTFTGVMGGAVDVADLIAVAVTENVDADLAGILGGLLELASDLEETEEGCSRISITFEFQGVPAFLFDEEAE